MIQEALLLFWLKIRVAGLPQCEANHVCEALRLLVFRGSDASMARIIVDAQEHRLAARGSSLQARGKLCWSPWLNAFVIDRRRDHHRRILHSVLNVRVRTHGVKVFKTLLGLDAAELGHIALATGGGLPPKHVSDRHFGDHRGKEIRPLFDGATDQNTSRALPDAKELGRAGIVLGNQILCAGYEIAPSVWLGELITGEMPGFSVIAATAQMRIGKDDASFDSGPRTWNVYWRPRITVG